MDVPKLIASGRIGNVHAMTRLLRRMDAGHLESLTLEQKREMIAGWCRVLGRPFSQPAQPPVTSASEPDTPPHAGPSISMLSPRLLQTFRRLLAGDSEKQIARQLKLSPHTIHAYVKAIYRHFDVCSRGELLAKFVADVHLAGGHGNNR